jgi:hypothetical protein
MIGRSLFLTGLLSLLIACVAAPQVEPPGQATQADLCGALNFAFLIGRSQTQIQRTTLPTRARVICHDCMATMDFVENRLNVQLDTEGNVSKIFCG